MKLKKCGIFLILVIFGITLSSYGQEIHFYVSPKGNDTYSGRKEQPFATLGRAKEAVKLLKKAGNKHSATITLAAGNYLLPATLVFTPDESGSEGAPYLITAAAGDKVTLSGAISITPTWVKYDATRYKTQVAPGIQFQSLFAGDKELIRARFPNYDPAVLPYGGYAEDALSPARVSGWKQPQTGYIHAMHSGIWGDMHYRITGKNADGTLSYVGGWQMNRPSPMHPKFRFVENIFEELDSPGEWFLDSLTHTLYLYPLSGMDLASTKFEASNLENLVEFRGSEQKPVKNIHLNGLLFTRTAPTFMKTREPLMRSDWAIYRGGAILFDGTEGCKVSNSTLNQLGGNAIFVSNYNHHAAITDNLIEDIGASAICFVGSPDAVRSPAYRYEEFVPPYKMDTIPGPKTANYPSQCLAYDNLICHIGRIEKQVAGVEIQLAADITVKHNSIYDVPRAGINIGDGAWGGHEIAFNDVFLTVLETGDHGAFNSWGRDRYWHPNRAVMDSLVAFHPNWIRLDAIKTTTIHNNRFRCDHGWDIDLDDGSGNYEIFNNLCLSGGLKLREGFYREVYNNILVNNGFHPHVWFKSSHDVFRNNIVMTSHQPIQINFWGDTVDYNFFTSQADLDRSRSDGAGIEVHAAAGNPQFVDPAEGDFRVKKGSAALAVGFKNFPMNQFGVTSARLRLLAAQPIISPLILSGPTASGTIFDWQGAEVKNIETLGEQSAAGLAAIRGVLVVKVNAHSALEKAGMLVGDVILKAQGEDINDFIFLEKVEKANKWKGMLILSVWRNQTLQEKSLHFLE
ncbi:Right handed beta helix region [bacterium A37T11]|nr:Right handed beta helix region [bacterium A37T11]